MWREAAGFAPGAAWQGGAISFEETVMLNILQAAKALECWSSLAVLHTLFGGSSTSELDFRTKCATVSKTVTTAALNTANCVVKLELKQHYI